MLDGKIWEWDLSFRWEWEWDGNGNEVIEMGGNCYEKSIPAHLYFSVRSAIMAHTTVHCYGAVHKVRAQEQIIIKIS